MATIFEVIAFVERAKAKKEEEKRAEKKRKAKAKTPAAKKKVSRLATIPEETEEEMRKWGIQP